jgi:hypothetical protein
MVPGGKTLKQDRFAIAFFRRSTSDQTKRFRFLKCGVICSPPFVAEIVQKILAIVLGEGGDPPSPRLRRGAQVAWTIWEQATERSSRNAGRRAAGPKGETALVCRIPPSRHGGSAQTSFQLL